MEYLIINKEYFTGIFQIENLTGSSVVVDSNISALNLAIKDYSEEYLTEILGEELAELFITELDALENSGTPLTIRFQNLLDLIRDESKLKSSLTGYVYFKYKNRNLSTTSAQGEQISNVENAILSENTTKIIRAMNDSIKKTQKIIEFLEENQSTYPELDIDYTNFIFEIPVNRGTFGI